MGMGGDLHDSQAHADKNDNLFPLVHLETPDEKPREQGEEEIDQDTENYLIVSTTLFT